MSEQEQKIIFSRNLSALMEEHNKTQTEVAKVIGVLPQTFNTWMMGKAIPRMDKIQKLADYFCVPKSSLIDSSKDVVELSVSNETIEKFSPLLEQLNEAEIEKAYDYVKMLLMADKYKEGVNGQKGKPAEHD